jgi:hypothetical protein
MKHPITKTLLFLLLPISHLLAQTPSSGGGTNIFYLAADVCGNDATSQYVLMRTTASVNFASQAPQISSRCGSGQVMGAVTAYAANPVACQKLNTKLGNCANTHVFTDVMATPSNGVVPSGARVLVFLSANPDVDIIPAGAYAALCGQGQLFVAFGNYSGSTPLLFNNNPLQTACGNTMTVTCGGQQIQYQPASLAPQDGAYVKVESSGFVWYGTAINCVAAALICPNPPLVVVLSPDLDICKGENTSLEAQVIGSGSGIGTNPNAVFSYKWSNNLTQKLIKVQPPITTDFTVTVTDAANPQCAMATKTTVHVFNPPTPRLMTQPSSVICKGSAFTLFHAFKEAVPTYNYVWRNERNIVVPNNTQPILNENTAGKYSLTIDFSNGCSLKEYLSVSYPTLPIVICENLNCDTAEGGILHLEAMAEANLFTWSGPEWTGLGRVVTVNYPYSGTYSVTATDANGCTHTHSKYIETCIGEPPVTSTSGQSVSIYDKNPQSARAESKARNSPNLVDSEITVFPNPAANSFQINVPDALGLCRVEVFDALMRPVFSEKNSQTVSVSVENWTSGVYFIRVQSLEIEAESCWKTVLIER